MLYPNLIRLMYILMWMINCIYLFRLIRTQMEYEMPAEEGTVMTMDEDDEVVLFWDPTYDKSSNKDEASVRQVLGSSGAEYRCQKGIRELAMGAADNIKADKEILDYYR